MLSNMQWQCLQLCPKSWEIVPIGAFVLMWYHFLGLLPLVLNLIQKSCIAITVNVSLYHSTMHYFTDTNKLILNELQSTFA